MKDKEKEITLIVEQANTELHLILKKMMDEALSNLEASALVFNLCDRTKASLEELEADEDFIKKALKSIRFRYVEWYKHFISTLKKNAKKTKNPIAIANYNHITGEELKNSNGIVLSLNENAVGKNSGTIANLEEMMTTNEYGGGGQWVDDYRKLVQNEMKSISEKNLVMKDSLGRRMSIRNLAEMTIRFEKQREQLTKLKDNGVKFLVASSHSDCSRRCYPFQSLIYILDVEPNSKFKQDVDFDYKPKPIGKTADNKDYYSLKDAMEHGFLGYNCRHRLIPYTAGMELYKQYSLKQVEKRHDLENHQRALERKIRKYKLEEKTMAGMQVQAEEFDVKSKRWVKQWIDDNGIRKPKMVNAVKQAQEKSKHYQSALKGFCSKNDLVYVKWRTSITNDESSTLEK